MRCHHMRPIFLLSIPLLKQIIISRFLFVCIDPRAHILAIQAAKIIKQALLNIRETKKRRNVLLRTVKAILADSSNARSDLKIDCGAPSESRDRSPCKSGFFSIHTFTDLTQCYASRTHPAALNGRRCAILRRNFAFRFRRFAEVERDAEKTTVFGSTRPAPGCLTCRPVAVVAVSVSAAAPYAKGIRARRLGVLEYSS